MPYLHSTTRQKLADGKNIATTGELNYCITKLLVEFVGTPYYYTRINEAIGALECAKLELYRRVAAPYEDSKKKENGDVY